jgi:hypothetical protein
MWVLSIASHHNAKIWTSLYYDSYVRYKENQTTIYEYAQYSNVKI